MGDRAPAAGADRGLQLHGGYGYIGTPRSARWAVPTAASRPSTACRRTEIMKEIIGRSLIDDDSITVTMNHRTGPLRRCSRRRYHRANPH